MLEAGKFRSIAEIAEAEKIDRAYVSRLLRLTLLAPDIQEAILEGWQPKGMQLEELTQAMASGWVEQRESFDSFQSV
jgi:ParB-like chromosome segregation protein Spo0J